MAARNPASPEPTIIISYERVSVKYFISFKYLYISIINPF
jgi:hypothetical protein